MAQPLPLQWPTVTVFTGGFADVFREDRILCMEPCDMSALEQQLRSALEQQLRSYEEELARLRVENDQLRRSSKAFGELAERLSVALQTATRVNRRSSAADNGGRRRALAES